MDYFLLALVAFLSGFGAIFIRPFSKLIVGIANALTPGQRFKSNIFKNEEELRELVDQAHERGLVEEDEHEMIHSVFELGDTLVRELMVPRTEMVWIEGSKNLRQGLSLALRSGFTRIPVIGENLVYFFPRLKPVARSPPLPDQGWFPRHLNPARQLFSFVFLFKITNSWQS